MKLDLSPEGGIQYRHKITNKNYRDVCVLSECSLPVPMELEKDFRISIYDQILKGCGVMNPDCALLIAQYACVDLHISDLFRQYSNLAGVHTIYEIVAFK